jgi:hypothetical protein
MRAPGKSIARERVPEGIRSKGRSSVFLRGGAANFVRRPIEPDAPVRAMEGFSQILLGDHEKTLEEEARRRAALIEDLIASNEQNGQTLSRSQRR